MRVCDTDGRWMAPTGGSTWIEEVKWWAGWAVNEQAGGPILIIQYS
jgi:hypothetical protein